MQSTKWRSFVVAAFTLLSLYSVIPTVIYFMQPIEVRNDAERLQQKIPDWLPSAHIKLGLDIQGGVQLVLGVDAEKAVDAKLSRLGTEIKRWSDDENKGVKNAFAVAGQQTLRIELNDGIDQGDFKELMHTEFPGLVQSDRDRQLIDFRFEDDQARRIKQSAIEQAERVIRSRIDKWGVSEPLISRRNDGSILVQLPGFKDPEKAKDLLGRTAQLSFKIVDDSFAGFDDLVGKLPENVKVDRSFGHVQLISEDREAMAALLKDRVPQDRELVFERKDLAGGKKSEFTSYVVSAATEIGGEDVLDSMVTVDSNSFDQRPAVSLKFTGPGGKRFADVTGANVKKRMAIILDSEVVSAPSINQKISGGTALITLGSGRSYNEIYEEANQLSLILKSGALPAKIEVLEQRQVGATLGPELAEQGIISVAIGLVMVLFFMVLYYRRPGLIACLALFLNSLFLLALMTGFGAALTLPGIAGFVLTLGMAVDANVLINERIRQELAIGKNARKAVENGFNKVVWTIVDANITTLIAALVLLETSSSGPIRGFAVTLMVGIIVSMFTSLYCSKLFFQLALSNQTSDAEVRRWLGSGGTDSWAKNFDFLKWSNAAIGLGLVVALVAIVTMATKGMNWSVDFAGGTEVELRFPNNVDSGVLRDAGQKAGISDMSVQALGGSATHYLLRFEKAVAAGDGEAQEAAIIDFQNKFKAALSEHNPDILRMDFVGPQVGRELQRQGVLSIFYAILGVFAYILLRFDMRFGPGAMLKMFQDVFVVLAFYALFQRSFDLTSVAALLTVVGYSINDTIVIYDRIRENLALHPKRNLRDLINTSLNETLSRSINTSVTTLISLIGILVIGTAQIWNFAAAMAVGIIAATFSSTFVATILVIWTENWRNARRKAATA